MNRTPKIRFKNFNDDWEQRKLTEILIQRTEHQKISDDAPLLAFSYAEGVINPEDKKSNKRDFIMTDKYNKIFSRTELNDIIYNPANVIHGAIHRNKLGTGVVSPIYKIFMCNGVSPKFIGERLHTDKFIQEVTKYIEGTVVKLRTLSPEMFLEMSIEIPKSYEEQDKIGTYFTNLDNLITLHQRKYDKLINIKKSMLEKMFPKEGENVPEIRFDGFTEPWEQRKLGDMMDVTSVKRIHQSDWTDSGVRFLRARDIVAESKNEEVSEPLFISQEKYDEYSAISGKVEKGDLLVTGVGTIGVPMLINSEEPLYFKDGNIIWFKNKNAIDGRFFYHSFNGLNIQKFIKESAGTGTVGTYTIETGKKTPINLPPQKEEQEKIGEYFSNLDNLITLHQRKLDKLKNIKASMLNKMFPED